MPRAVRTDIVQPDGRHVYLYGDLSAAPEDYRAPSMPSGVFQRRWNPLRREWVLVAASRQARTFLPGRDECPLCPSRPGHSTEIPAAAFQAAVFENRFPAMVPAKPAGGVCEVVVYTDEHEGSFATLPASRLAKLAEVWTDRYRALSARPGIRYVYIFENRGEQVGVTLNHPHGQIYAYPYIPPVPATELRRQTRGCLQCRLIDDELQGKRRILINAGGIVGYVPGYARWPYEVHVMPRTHGSDLTHLPPAGRVALLTAMQQIARAYDRLFDVPMPYMMAMHQAPARRAPAQAHLHVEFYPILRDKGKLKYLAGSESGAGAFINDTLAEESAERLRVLLE
ncbi:MAG TPA: galactose-1-phosphate uridylyltransferase [Candidatus Dormibacteraeota bacterium]|nr:galactose-1-phosphate uridylyltransferase [Candidatus Dormibacteraeota bacterium]